MSSATSAPHISAAPAHGASSIFVIGLLASLAGLMFGLDIGVISGAQSFIQKDFHISDRTLEWVVSSMMAGAAMGALGCSWLSASLGRKRSLMLGGILFVIGSLVCALAPMPEVLIGGRFVLGIAIGIASYTAPLYIAEIAPEATRGRMISTYQLMITTGILVAFLSDTAFSYQGSWRWMLGVIAIPGILFLVGLFALPDSPRWLMMRGQKEEATRVLMRLRGDRRLVDKEVSEIAEQLKKPQVGFTLFKENSHFRRSVWLGVLLQAMQQFTGMNVVMYYAPRIFQAMGYATEAQMWFTALVGLTNVLATLIAMAVIDRWGRKPTLYTGFTVMAIGLGVVGFMMMGGAPKSHDMQLFTVIMLLVFIVGFAMSAGPLIWTLCSEIQPLKGRDFGIAASTFTNWITNMIVGATFLSLLNGLGTSQTFWLYGGLNAVFLILTFLLVPETKGVTLEHIESRLMAGEKLRDIGQ
ncbi:sugar porter family MFS transporter [Dyella sp.]|uniref:sugar porter family MFS transporter n=1 Tax=Dyella sp. TaxID=1869338 RepID=UPI002ED29DA7